MSSFIRLGSQCLRKSKIACIDVRRTLDGHLALCVEYEEPYAVATGLMVDYSPTMFFKIKYNAKAKASLTDDINEIVSTNAECLIESGAAKLLREQRNRE